jgi:hypothetical protein
MAKYERIYPNRRSKITIDALLQLQIVLKIYDHLLKQLTEASTYC